MSLLRIGYLSKAVTHIPNMNLYKNGHLKIVMNETFIHGINYGKELSPAQLENAKDHSYIDCSYHLLSDISFYIHLL